MNPETFSPEQPTDSAAPVFQDMAPARGYEWMPGTLVYDQHDDILCRFVGFRWVNQFPVTGAHCWVLDVPVRTSDTRRSPWALLKKPLTQVAYPVTGINESRFLFLKTALATEDYAHFVTYWNDMRYSPNSVAV